MTVLSAITKLYTQNQHHAVHVSRKDRHFINMFYMARSEKHYGGSRFMDLLIRLIHYNKNRRIFFKRNHPYITALFNECKKQQPVAINNTVDKAAVLIGINYTGTKSALHGCENDVYDTKKILMEKYGYKDENILILTETEKSVKMQPTYQNIITAIHWLVKMGKEGCNTLWFQYSGHGFYMKDTDGDEADGYDECLVTGDNYALLDDHLRHYLIDSLPKECNLFCFMDCCHSGTMLDLKYKYKSGSAPAMMIENKNQSKCSVISLSGCRDNQVSMDAHFNNKYAGALTKTFWRAVKSNKYKTMGLFALVNLVRTNLKKGGFDQVPQLTCSHSLNKNTVFSI